FDSRRYFFAHGNHMRDLITILSAHWDFANQPVSLFAILVDRLLLDTMDFASGKYPPEFLLQDFALLFGQHVENVASQHDAARQTQFSQLAVSVPGDDAIVTVDRVKRQRQAVDNRFGESVL